MIPRLVAAALDEHGHTPEARDLARGMALSLPGGRDAYVRAVLLAAPRWRLRLTRIPRLDASLRRWVDAKRGARACPVAGESSTPVAIAMLQASEPRDVVRVDGALPGWRPQP